MTGECESVGSRLADVSTTVIKVDMLSDCSMERGGSSGVLVHLGRLCTLRGLEPATKSPVGSGVSALDH